MPASIYSWDKAQHGHHDPFHFHNQSDAKSISHLLTSQITSIMVDIQIFLSTWPGDQAEAKGLTSPSRFLQALPVPTN